MSRPRSASVTAPKKTARHSGLAYTSDTTPGYSRKRTGKSFRFFDAAGKPLKKSEAERARALVIPPAWTDVWICPKPNGHLQATGRDARGRKQYRYHDGYRAHRETSKYHHMLDFAEALPLIRRHVKRDMARRDLCRERVLASVITLLEKTLIRVGNADYAKQNKSYGLTTLHNRHVEVKGSQVTFKFKGKSGKDWERAFTDKRIAKVVSACRDMPGQDLFAFYDDKGAVHDVTSSHVNTYLKDISKRDVTAKDYRTWAATLMAIDELRQRGLAENKTEAKRHVTDTIKNVAALLGNTPAICRKSYLHPVVVESYHSGKLFKLKENSKLTIKNFNTFNSNEKFMLQLLSSSQGKRGTFLLPVRL